MSITKNGTQQLPYILFSICSQLQPLDTINYGVTNIALMTQVQVGKGREKQKKENFKEIPTFV